MGCAVGLDDFGTGYSAVALLSELPISFIKLDRTFVSRLHTVSGRAITGHFVSWPERRTSGWWPKALRPNSKPTL
jgi:EAL domain-containing protein (putative c-di-GMP-specific phosphodiesterase class I)